MKLQPSTLLAYLIALASIGGAVLHSKKISKQSAGSPSQQKHITELKQQVAELQSENQGLQNLLTGGTEVTLPIAHFKFVEDNIGLTFPEHVIAKRVDMDTMMEAVRYRYIQQFTVKGMAVREYAFHKLGLLPAGKSFMTALALAEANGAICIYDSSANELLLSAEYDEENPAHASSIIKHLAVALLEQNFPLTRKQAVFLTDDSFHARNGFIRGRASSVAQRYNNINAYKKGPDGHQKQTKPNVEAQAFFNSLPLLIQGLTTFPVIHGKTYIEDLIINQDSVFPELYINMPKSTATIFAKKMPLSETLTAQPNMAANEFVNTQLGQIHAMLYLQQLEYPSPDLHTQLTSDRLTVSQKVNKPSVHTIKWTTHWKTPEHARAFYEATTLIGRQIADPPSVTLSKNQVIIQFIDIHTS